ncbi:uncharacterized protein DUF1289 [Crenobacter luteus]|uniref:DUF1289 domain-containing protein n=1 Tax=Crenobacter luteus TaxID=1452487 RepID=A0A163B9S2_9NEIS|nr:DUF1289 domain-containing protein [Crenobacter luteus]KZE25324.1 hypothetical protein AVW16_03215 [Crenobacter luteus]TCP07874.1 uncharacterized protein DUF1289 [Crenobacter luteus]
MSGVEHRDSPCVAVCTTALGDPVCRGCGRTFDEVAHWTALDDDAKRDVWARLEARRRLVEIGRILGWLVAIERDAAGEEWAWVPARPELPRFRLARGAGCVRLALRDAWGGEPVEAMLGEGVAPSAQAYAELLAERAGR